MPETLSTLAGLYELVEPKTTSWFFLDLAKVFKRPTKFELEYQSQMHNRAKTENRPKLGKIHLEQNPKSPIILLKGQMFAGSIYVGSNDQKLPLVFDTSSDVVLITDSTCTSCKGTLFNKSSSTSFTGLAGGS